ncbi:aldo/keto reductase [Endozoicomonadaceae bacterium StTr2]
MDVSVLGFGTVKLGRDKGVKYPHGFTIPDDREAGDLIAMARDRGINLIDTAPAYGTSEERLGKLLQGQRDQWLICSKVGEEFENGESRFDFTPKHIRFSVERSLKRLNTDCIDMLLVHSDGNDLQIINDYEVFNTLDQLKQEGLIRAGGMSTKTVEGGIATLKHSDIAMVTWNLNEQAEIPVVDYALEHNKGIFIKKGLASGHACLQGEDPVQASLNMLLGHQGVSSVIVGTVNPLHLHHNIQAAANACK